MLRAGSIVALMALICGALIACGGAQQTATPIPAAISASSSSPAGSSVIAPISTPATPIASPSVRPASSPVSSPVMRPTPTIEPGGTLVPPTLREVQPAVAAPGERVRVIGGGGFVRTASGGYNESSRQFPLEFDGQVIGTISCYVNRCEGTLTIPADAAPGPHLISSDGGGIVVSVK